MLQIPDKYKLILLALSFTACTLTYFLPNASHHLSSIKNVSPPVDRYCRPLQQKYQTACKRDEDSFECDNLRNDAQDCREAIVSAYRRINVKCLRYSVEVQLCSEDCGDESSEDSKDGGECIKICSKKGERLKGCEKGYVAKELKSYGIQDLVSLE